MDGVSDKGGILIGIVTTFAGGHHSEGAHHRAEQKEFLHFVVVLVFLLYLKAHTPDVEIFIPIVGEDFEVADFGGVLDVGADASAEVVVADADEAECLAGVVGQLPEVHLGRHLATLHEFVANGQMLRYDLVDAALNFRHLRVGGAGVEEIVAFALLALYMSVPRPRAAEHPHHRLVQNMLRRMHWRVFFFVVSVQYRFFHALIT